FSLLASFTLTPMMCATLLKAEKPGQKKNVFVRLVDRATQFLLVEYRKIFDFMFRFPKSWSVFIILTLVGSCSVTPYIGNEFIPISDENRIQINLTLPQGSTIWETSRVAKEIEKMCQGYPEIKS